MLCQSSALPFTLQAVEFTGRLSDGSSPPVGAEESRGAGSYYGASYGTALDSTYASMFPERTDRVVIDSNIGATRGPVRRQQFPAPGPALAVAGRR